MTRESVVELLTPLLVDTLGLDLDCIREVRVSARELVVVQLDGPLVEVETRWTLT